MHRLRVEISFSELFSCPQDMSRMSLGFYYSNHRPDPEIIPGNQIHGTIFKARKDDANDKAALNIMINPKRVLRKSIPPVLLK